MLTDKVRPGNYFVYAEAIPGHAGELKTWSGETPLCVQNDSLFTLRNQDVCTDDPRRQREFVTVEIGPDEEGAYTTEFVDENNFTLFSAEAVPRLASATTMSSPATRRREPNMPSCPIAIGGRPRRGSTVFHDSAMFKSEDGAKAGRLTGRPAP